MKAGLTVLVAIASASVNAHVKVETVNFDEDLLNTEKNIAGTFAWKEKASGRRELFVNFKFEMKDIKFKGSGDKKGEEVYSCTGDLTIGYSFTIGTTEYSDVTLEFKRYDDRSKSSIYTGLSVKMPHVDKSWMDDYATYEKNGEVSEHSFKNMEENYQTMRKLYNEMQKLFSEGKTEEMKGTEKEMKWTIPLTIPPEDDYMGEINKTEHQIEMINKTGEVIIALEPHKKVL